MENQHSVLPSVVHAEPVFAVSDVVKTVNYYHEVLGFPDHWTWGEPANHGGVSWNGAAFLQFSLDPEVAARTHGESAWLRVKNLGLLYLQHQKQKVEIIVAKVNRPWGFTEYTIRDINGYYITFAEPTQVANASSDFPTGISIVAGIPGVEELRKLAEAVGWQPSTNTAMQQQINTAVYSVVAEDQETNEIIGCAFLMGDNKTFYYVKDVIVHPSWQRKQIGTALMRNLMTWLETKGAENATVGLFTGEHLAAFYRQFGFTQACGMYQQVRRKVSH